MLLVQEFSNLPEAEVRQAAHKAWVELENTRKDIQKKGEEVLAWMERTHLSLIHIYLLAAFSSNIKTTSCNSANLILIVSQGVNRSADSILFYRLSLSEI